MELQMQQQRVPSSSSVSSVSAQQQQRQQTAQPSATDKFDSLKACAKRLFHQKNKDLTDVTTQRTVLEQLEAQHHGATALLSKGTQKAATLDAELEALQISHSATVELNQEVNISCAALSSATDKIHRARGVGAAVNAVAKRATTAAADSFNGKKLEIRLAEVENRVATTCLPAPQLRSLQADLVRSLDFLVPPTTTTISKKSSSAEDPQDFDASSALQNLSTLASAMRFESSTKGDSSSAAATNDGSLLLPSLNTFMEELDSKEKGSADGTSSWAPHIRQLTENLRESSAAGLTDGQKLGTQALILLDSDDKSDSFFTVSFPNFVSDPTQDELGTANELCTSIYKNKKKSKGNKDEKSSSYSPSWLTNLEKLANTELPTELLNQSSTRQQYEEILGRQQKLQDSLTETECKEVNLQTVTVAREQSQAEELTKEKQQQQRLEELKKRAEELDAEERKVSQEIEFNLASTASALTATENREKDNEEVEKKLVVVTDETAKLNKEAESFSTEDASSEVLEKRSQELQMKLSELLVPGKDIARKLEETQERELISLSSALRNLDTIEQSNLVAYLPLATAMMEEQLMNCSQTKTGSQMAAPSQPESEISQQPKGKKTSGTKKKKGGRRVSFSQQSTNNAAESGDEVPPASGAGVQQDLLPQPQQPSHHHHQLQTVMDLILSHGPQLKELLLTIRGDNNNHHDHEAASNPTSTTVHPTWCWDLLSVSDGNNNDDEGEQQHNNNNSTVSIVVVNASTIHPSLADLSSSDPSLKRLGRDVELQLTCRHNEHNSTLNKVNQLISECISRQDSLLVTNGLE